MRVLLIIRSDTQIRRDILKSRQMDCLNEQCADSIRKLREIFFFKVCKQGRERERTDNEQMTSSKSRFMLASEKECSQSMVKGKKGNESMGVGERGGESALYSLGCQFTSKPSQPPTSQSCLKGCCFGCRVPTTTYRQTEWV